MNFYCKFCKHFAGACAHHTLGCSTYITIKKSLDTSLSDLDPDWIILSVWVYLYTKIISHVTMYTHTICIHIQYVDIYIYYNYIYTYIHILDIYILKYIKIISSWKHHVFHTHSLGTCVSCPVITITISLLPRAASCQRQIDTTNGYDFEKSYFFDKYNKINMINLYRYIHRVSVSTSMA